MATTPLNFDTEQFASYGMGFRPDESAFTTAQSDPTTYNNNVLGYLNGVRNEMLRGNVFGGHIGEVDDYIKSLSEQANDPSIYYKAKLDFIANNIGRNAKMGEDTSSWQKQLQDVLPEAIKSGVPEDSIQNLLDTSYNAGQGRGAYQLNTNFENVGGPINKYGHLLPLLAFAPAAAAEFGAAGAAGAAEGAAAGAAAGPVLGLACAAV